MVHSSGLLENCATNSRSISCYLEDIMLGILVVVFIVAKKMMMVYHSLWII
jgi:hypothetical protein